MYEILIEYFAGSYRDGEKVYKLTIVKTDREDYKTLLDEMFGENYNVLEINND